MAALGFFSTEDTLTPQTIERRRKLAEALQNKASDTSPIRHWTQGAARVLDGFVGGLEDRRLNDAEKSNQTYSASKLAEAIAAFGGGSSDTPASSSPSSGSPVSLPGATASTPQGAVMPPEQVKQVIDQNVPEADRDYYYRLAQKESSFNPNAVSPTGAAGLVQFTKGTGRQYGLVGPDGDIRKDPVANIQAGVRFTEDNRNALRQALGRDPTYGELALAHQQGAGGAISLLRGGNVPSQNLAVNNAGGLTGQAAASKIMSYYNMPGGQRPYQTASLTPMAAPAVDRMTPEQAAGIGAINPVQRGTISPDGMQMPLASGEAPGAMPAVASGAPTAPMPNAAGGVAPGTMMPMGAPQPRLPAGPAGGPMAYAASGAPVQTDDKGNAIQTPATAAPGQKAIVAALRTPAAPSPSGEVSPQPPAAAPVQMAQAPTQGTAAPAAAPAQASPAAAAQNGNSRRLALAAAIMSDPRVDAGTKQVAASLLSQALQNKVTYQTDAEGNIIALDPNNRTAPQVVYKAAAKPIVLGADQRAIDSTGRVIIGPSSEANTPDQKNYEAAKREGYTGSFNDWLTGIKKAGATNVNLPSSEKSYDTKVGGAYGDQFVEMQKAGRDAAGQLNTLGTMEKLIESPDFYSGAGGSKVTAFKRGMVALGFKDAETAAPNELFEKLSKQFVLDKAGGSLGAQISNGDRDYINATVANIDNTPAGNKAILQLGRRLSQRQIEVARMARDYAKANGGRIDAGFDDQLARYVEANPITADLPKPQASPPVRGQVPAAGGAAGAPVRVQTPDEARRLPKGTPIILPDGRTGVVP